MKVTELLYKYKMCAKMIDYHNQHSPIYDKEQRDFCLDLLLIDYEEAYQELVDYVMYEMKEKTKDD